jgi:branched-chain amino acid aminotransferase
MKIFVNGRVVDEEKAVISVADRGFLYGDGLFETLNIKIKRDRKYIRYILLKLLRANGLKDAYIRLTVTRGRGRAGLNIDGVKEQGMVIVAGKIQPYPGKMYKRGIALSISPVRRNERSPASLVKSLNYLDGILARIEAGRQGADDALLLNTKGDVAETTVSNIFMIKKNELITPAIDSGALPGITRDIILALANEAGLKPVERRVKPKELITAKEAFATNTLMQVMPVTKIDTKKIGTGKPGPITKKIHRLYRTLTA